MRKKLTLLFVLFILIIAISIKVDAKTLDEIRATYPNGGVWTGGSQCDGFANNVYKEFYGMTPAFYGEYRYTLADIEPGDKVRYYYNSNDDEHSVWIIARNGEWVDVAEANYDTHNGIRWTTKSIYEFGRLKYVAKAPYRLGSQAPTIAIPTNVNLQLNKTTGLKVTWNIVDKTTGYIVKLYTKADIDANRLSNPIETKEVVNAIGGNYNYAILNTPANAGDYYAIVYAKMGNLTSSYGKSNCFSVKGIDSVSITTSVNEVAVGSTIKMNVSYLPQDATNPVLNVSVDDESIASYNSKTGLLRGLKAGTTNVRVTSANGKTDSISVRVIDGIPVSGFNLNATSKSIKVGERFQIKVTSYRPENATITNVYYTDYDNTIISVDENGWVTGLKEGSTRVMVNMGTMGMSVAFTVNAGTLVNSVKLDKSYVELEKDEEVNLVSTVLPQDATNKNLIWTSSDESVATVTNGKVVGVGEGSCVITATSTDGSNKQASCEVDVILERYDETEEMHLNYETYQFNGVEDRIQLKALLKSGKTTATTWKSSDSEIVSVDKNGLVTSHKGGFAYIYANSKFYGKKRCWIYVSYPVVLSDGSRAYAGDLDGNGVFDANDSSTILEIFRAETGKGDNLLLGDVDCNGMVDANDASLILEIYRGETFNPGALATIRRVILSKENVEINENEDYRLNATVNPSNTQQDKTITYSSDDETIATVDVNTGLIHGIKEGTTIVRATSSNGKVATCTVKVNKYVEPEEIVYPDGLNKVDGIWYYFIDNQVQTDFTGLVKRNDTWYYVQNGKIDWGVTTLVKKDGTWFYVNNSMVDWSYTGLVKKDGAWFYIQKGVLHWGVTTLVKKDGTWFYVNNSMVDWSYTGLVKKDGAWFYIQKGVLHWGVTTLVKKDGTWFYVNNSMVDWSYTGLVEKDGKLFYVQKGILYWGYNGNVQYQGKTYIVKNSMVDL